MSTGFQQAAVSAAFVQMIIMAISGRNEMVQTWEALTLREQMALASAHLSFQVSLHTDYQVR